MLRMLDLTCECGEQVRDLLVADPPDVIKHWDCGGGVMQVEWLPRPREAQWGDRSAITVFRKPDGTISYPGRNDAETPRGCERVELRSLRDVERFEKQHGVRSEVAWYDRGSGRSADDDRPTPKRVRYFEGRRYEI